MTPLTGFDKRRFLLRASAGLAALAGTGVLPRALADDAVIRIGVLKASITLRLMQDRGTLEKAGIKVQWTPYDSGPPLMTAMENNLIDFGSVGEGPPVISQSNGADFVYVGYEVSNPDLVGLLVQKFSRINRVADLKGKKIAVLMGSNAHWLILALLKQAGLRYSDIELVYLSPDDAFVEFKRGAVDAWAIWDPKLGSARAILGARLLAPSNVKNYYPLVARRKFFLKQGPLVHQIIDLLNLEGQWMKHNVNDAAARMMHYAGLSEQMLKKQIALSVPVYKHMDATAISNQQEIADAFWESKAIPRRVQAKDIAF